GTVNAQSGIQSNDINVGSNGKQTTYAWPYESIGTDSAGHNLRLFSHNFVYCHAALGVEVSNQQGGNGNLIVDGMTTTSGLTVTGIQTNFNGVDGSGFHYLAINGVQVLRFNINSKLIDTVNGWAILRANFAKAIG